MNFYKAGWALFCVAIGAYVAALVFAGSFLGEVLSDVGNAVMLITAVLLLLRMTKKQVQDEEGKNG